MKSHVLRGTKQEIAEGLARIRGVVREAIVFEEEERDTPATASKVDDIFAEMQPYEAWSGVDVDDSREATYTRLDGD